jgi:quercetin dioxygenase-like cupin family protein
VTQIRDAEGHATEREVARVREDGVTDDPPPGIKRLAWRGPDAPSPDAVARRLREEGVEPHRWSNGPGDRYATHQHGYDKVLMCAAGSITFLVGAAGDPVELHAGDGFILPAGTSHAAVVGPQGCVCLEGSR